MKTRGRFVAVALAVVILAGAGLVLAQSVGLVDQEVLRYVLPSTNTTGYRAHTDGAVMILSIPVGALITSRTFAQLPAIQHVGAFTYCSDCTKASPCASGGTGAFAKHRASAGWDCD